MSITDELMEYIWQHATNNDELRAIADRIDERHKHAIGYVDDRDPETMAENGWVKLPVDADGEVIRTGDMLDGYGKTVEIVELRYGRSGWVLISRDGSGYADPFAFAHHHEPTVDDVLLDACRKYHSLMVESMSDVSHDMPAPSEIIAEYAPKLRLAGGEDE